MDNMISILAYMVAKQINTSVEKQKDYVIPSAVLILNLVPINR